MPNLESKPDYRSENCANFSVVEIHPIAPPCRSSDYNKSHISRNHRADVDFDAARSKEDKSGTSISPISSSAKVTIISNMVTGGLFPGLSPIYPGNQSLDLEFEKAGKNSNANKVPELEDEEEMTTITENQSYLSGNFTGHEELKENEYTAKFDLASRKISLIAIAIFLLVISLVLGLFLWMDTNYKDSDVGISQLDEDALKEVTYSPSLRSPTLPQPSTSPSLRAEWSHLGDIEGNFIGNIVGFIDEMVLVTNDTQAQVHQQQEYGWEPFGEPLFGELLCISESNRVVIRDSGVLKVFEFSDDVWFQVGDDILSSIYPESVSMSGDGSTIAVSMLQDESLLRSQIFRINDTGWLKLGNNIIITVSVALKFQTVFSYNGNIIAFGFANDRYGFSTTYSAPLPGLNSWTKVLNDGRAYGGGPSIALSKKGTTLLTSGNGLISAYTIDDQNIGKRLELEDSREDAVLAIANDGLSFAYGWLGNLRVVDLVDSEWKAVGPLPEITCTYISSLSFSSDGKLAVGCENE
eukprot:CAMPEP_0178899438 /NCGR_PEP_ID=MMETSP0786-20121207/2902_1 /TAXON_ID=186022 /ORGANISM="Thalassionema frauenfeldii, Strain CCMP 1798" /LENGTH=523 /DNA_ID=CAMNT_0020570299 /DNA_START=95 /DNA_END=1663 /DNA_ORIENTATION=-